MPYFETCATNNTGVEDIFIKLSEKSIKSVDIMRFSGMPNVLQLNAADDARRTKALQEKKSDSCC